MVPLPEPAREIPKVLSRHSGAVLASPGARAFNSWSKAKKRLDEPAGVASWRLHDLPRSLATGMQRHGVRLEVTEAALNHRSFSRAGIVRVYQRHQWTEEKRMPLDAWADYLLGLTEGRAAGRHVIELRRAWRLAAIRQ